ncbi:hypothetical protein C8Q76DRAFT_736426 [Earliella scabrosa]|nr:hypothetical protein C8Q76DRAFT_736426 [Earliella scabrosa]
MTYTLRAFAPIAAGEEITITYIGRPLSYADRQAELTRKYHFECKCATCSLPDALRAVSDMRRAMIGLRAVEAAQDEVLFQKWLAEGAPEQPLKRIRIHQFNHLDGFRRMEMAWFCMRQEGWFDDALWEPVLARLVRGCSVWESEEDVRKYALDAALLRKTFTGSDGGWAAVAANPRQTDWWAKLGRGAKRAPFS